jgi:hypothetical protein
MQRDQHSIQNASFSSEERLMAFGAIIGEATTVWNWNGRPIRESIDAPLPLRSLEVCRFPTPDDLPGRIVSLLVGNGPQSPGAIGIRVGRSHRVVFEALKWLLIRDVATALGSTRNRRYAISNDWKAALMRARELDCLDKKITTEEKDTQNA